MKSASDGVIFAFWPKRLFLAVLEGMNKPPKNIEYRKMEARDGLNLNECLKTNGALMQSFFISIQNNVSLTKPEIENLSLLVDGIGPFKICHKDHKNLGINQAQIDTGPAIHQNADYLFMQHENFVGISFNCALCGQFMKQPALQSATGISKKFQ